MCTLLTVDEATAHPRQGRRGDPERDRCSSGLGTNCIYQTDPTRWRPARSSRSRSTRSPTRRTSALLTLRGGTSSQIASSASTPPRVDVGELQNDAALVIRLTDPDKPPSMLIQAPTLDMAKAVAEKILGRLDTLK